MRDDVAGRRRTPGALVAGGVRVADQRHVVPAREGAVDRGPDADVRLGPRDHQAADAGLGQHLLQVRGFEGVAERLVHERLRVGARQLRHELPGLAVAGHLLVRVLHPHDRHPLGTCAVDEPGDGADDGVARVRLAHHVVLDVDHDECGVGSV